MKARGRARWLVAMLLAAEIATAQEQSVWPKLPVEMLSPWRQGTLLQSQYREQAGVLLVGSSCSVALRSEGHDFWVMPPDALLDQTLVKDRTPAILKGIPTVVTLPGRDSQYFFWPSELTIKTSRVTLNDPAPSHWRWLADPALPPGATGGTTE